MAITWTGAGVFGTIGKAIKEANANSVNASAVGVSARSFIRQYILYNYRYLAESTYQNWEDMWWLALVADMDDDSQTVNGNAVTAGAVTFSGAGTMAIQDAAASPVADQVSPTQMLLDDDVFRIECTAASAGNDTWVVNSMRRGRISKTARTAQLYGEELTADDVAGISFTILEPTDRITADPSSVLTSFAITGGEKSVNSDDDGKLYVEVLADGYGGYDMVGYPTSADRTAKTNAVFSVNYSATGGHTISEENSSGLAGTVTIQTLATSSAITLELKIAYAVGDAFYVAACTSDDGGVIQTYMRDAYSKTLPYDTTGSETIADSLAT